MVLENISWGELIILGAVGVTLVGRQSLPGMFHKVGRGVGRGVGILIGARQRMDKFAANNELQKLQHELRSGLRELDAVRTELAIASSSNGLVGREFGSRLVQPPTATNTGPVPSAAATQTRALASPTLNPIAANAALPNVPIPKTPSSFNSSTREQSVAAIAEDEWAKRGIGFRSRAEQGTFGSWAGNDGGQNKGGASILNELLSETLIYDQYDRVIKEQQEALQSKADQVQKDRQKRQNLDSENAKQT